MSKKTKKFRCDDCGAALEIGAWPFCGGDKSKHRVSRVSSAFFAPITVFVDGQGNTRIPGSSYAKPPKGFDRVEITTRRQAEKLTKELSAKDSDKFWRQQERENHFFNGMLGRNRVETEKMLEGVTDPKIREFMHVAMREGDKSDRISYDPGIYFQVLE